MLNFLRKRASSWAIKFIFSLIIVVFVLRGVGAMREKEQTIVGSIGDTKISTGEFQSVLNLVSESYKSLLGERFDYKVFEDKIKKEAWDVIVEQTLLLKKAEELKMKVSDGDVIAELKKQEAFKENGQFSRDRYLNVLQYIKTSPAAYERQVERSLLMKKTMAMLKNSVDVGDSDVENFYRVRNKAIRAGYATFSYKDFLKSAASTDEEDKKYYEENKEKFKKPESANISYVFLPFQDFAGGIKVEEKDLKDYYGEHKEEFMQPKTYVLRHIVSSFGKDKDAARKKIEAANKLVSKEDFAKIAGRVNDDGTKNKGGMIGEISINMVTPKLAAKLASMKKGDISDVVESEYGYHILKIDDLKDERMREINEVKTELASMIKENKAKLYAMKKASEIKSGMEAGKGKDEAGKYSMKKIDVAKDNPVLGELGAMPEIVKNFFAAGEGKVFGPTPITKGVIVGKVNNFERGYYSIAEVKGKIKEGVLKNKSLELAFKKAEEALKNKTTLKGAVTDWFSPAVALPAPLNTISELGKDILGLSKKQTVLSKVYKGADSAYIVYLVDERTKEWNPASDEARAFREEFANNKRNVYFNAWMKEEKASTKIKQNEMLFKNM